jgi:glutaredoxin 3
MANGRTATLHRMVLPDHTCPYGVRAKELLEERGFEVDDQVLNSREEVEAFKSEHGLSTTPLVVIDGEEIGGAAELEDYLASEDANA